MLKLLLILLSVTSFVAASAQWKRLGWDGYGTSMYQRGDVFYGIYGAFVHRSTDDGESWTDISTGLPLTRNSSPIFFGFDADDLTVRDNASSYEFPHYYPFGTYIFRRESSTWEFYDDSLYGGMYGYKSIRLGRDSAFRILPGTDTWDNSKVFFTSDQGASWNLRSPSIADSGGLIKCDYISYYKGKIFANFSQYWGNSLSQDLYMSSDAGMSWKKSPLSNSNLYTSIYYPNSSYALFGRVYTPNDTVDDDGLFRSIDTGTTWQEIKGIPLDGFWNLQFLKDINGKLFAGFDYYSDTTRIFPVFSSSDSGLTWQREYILDSTDRIVDLYKRNASKEGYIVAVYSSTGPPYIRLDNYYQPNGVPAFKGTFGETGLLLSAQKNQLIAKRVYINDSVFLSTDGLTWTSRPFIQGQLLENIPWLRSDKYIYAVSRDSLQSKTVFRSSDHGETWKAILSPEGLNVFEFTNIGDTLLFTIGSVNESRSSFLSTDAGDSWHTKPLPSVLSSHNVVGYQYGTLFAENTVNQHTNYFQSTDFGETWSEFKFPFGKDTAVHHLFFDGFTIIATASTKVDDQYKGHKSYMIYASRDKGLSWQRYAESLPSNATITKFLRDGSTIYLLSTPGATGNAKVFISKDNWNSWAQLPGVVPDARWLFVDGSNVYLTTNLYGSIYQQSLESLTVKNPILNLQSSFTITPNPTSQNCTARFTKSPNTRIVKIVDICGRELQQYNLQPGTDVMVLQTADLPSGVYFVRVADGASISTVILQIQ